MQAIDTLDEFYNAVERLIVSLRSNMHEQEANIIDHRMHIVSWTTSSELLDELSEVLDKMKGSYPEEIQKTILKCQCFIRDKGC